MRGKMLFPFHTHSKTGIIPKLAFYYFTDSNKDYTYYDKEIYFVKIKNK